MPYPHSTTMNMMGPAAVSTLQRKHSEFKHFDPSGAISNPNVPTSNVITNSVPENASTNNTFVSPMNHVIASSASDTFPNNSANGSDFKNITTPSSTTSSTIESPKQQKKLKHLIFSGKNLKKLVTKNKDSNSITYQNGLTGKTKDGDGNLNENANSDNTSKRNAAAMAQAAIDDRHRRKFFSHHDVSSLCASLGGMAHVARAKEALERRNTTTGASAASAALRSGHSASNDGSGVNSSSDSPDVDHGDNVSNELVLR